MIREFILLRLHEAKKSQKQLSEETGIEYTAINQFLNGRKGLRYSNVEKILNVVKYKLKGTEIDVQDIRKAVWLEISSKHLGMRNVAKDIGASYNLLYGFIYGKNNMTVDKVERLMARLDISFVSYD